MDITNINSLEALLDCWKEKHFSDGKIRFIYDGCANSSKYMSCNKKVMLILKEGYFDESDCILEERANKPWVKYFKRDGNNWIYRFDENLGNEKPWYMWCRVESLVRPIISKITGGNIAKPLEYISVVNLKKSKDQAGGGEPDNSNVWSNDKRVEEYAIEDRDLLIKQIELLDPDIVICGGTYSMCMNANILGNVKSKVYDFEPKQLRSLWLHEIELASKKKNVQVIDMYHPSVPMKYDVMGELIAGAIIEQ